MGVNASRAEGEIRRSLKKSAEILSSYWILAFAKNPKQKNTRSYSETFVFALLKTLFKRIIEYLCVAY